MVETTPFDLWKYSSEFAEAGRLVKRSVSTQVSMPALFLFGQSVELSLKAFLLGRGMSINKLKSMYGHDLRKLLKEARHRKLGLEIKLEAIDIGLIGLLGYEYERKRYQYSRKELGETMYVPLPSEMELTTFKLLRGVQDFCERKSSKM
jgi:HEPN domain-containing protein